MPRAASTEALLRKGFAASVVALGLLAAGCGAGAQTPQPTTGGQAAPAPTSTAAGPKRTGPAKSLTVADKCSLVPQQQWQGLGADQTPRARDSNGQSGCTYQKGAAGTTGWSVFVAAAPGTTFQQEVEQRGQPAASGELGGGYPFAEFPVATGCVLFADVSDQGHLIANIARNSPDDPGVDLCQQAQKFAQAAVQSLPNA